LWNVKRIRPQSLEPVDYTRENYTRALWFAEGVTSTYADYTLVRSGIWTPGRFYDNLASNLDQLESRPAHRWKSAEEASLDAWYEGYALYRKPEFSISYYNKGYLLGVLLDILIRDLTANRASLDDVLRYLNSQYAKQGRFYEDSAGIRQAVEAVVGSTERTAEEGLAEIRQFFWRYVEGVDPLPAKEYLLRAGLDLDQQSGRTVIRELPNPTEQQRKIREGLLRGETQPE
jgi:predicted metalloprotease with PDZ domain